MTTTISHGADLKPDDGNGGDDENSPNYDSVGKHLDKIAQRLDAMQDAINRIEAKIAKADATISNVAEQVMPTVDTLMNHPLVKGLTFGKKNK
jgi:hypothetical protein